MNVELRLSGLTVQMIADNGHIPGYPKAINPDLVASDDADAALHTAMGRWMLAATRHQIGRGSQYRGDLADTDAAAILDYVESVAGALMAAEDPDVRAEGRNYEKSRQTAIRSLRQQGVPVVGETRGRSIAHRVGDMLEAR